MKNFLFIIAFLIVLTSVIIGINPQMHKAIIIGGANMTFTNQDIVKSDTNIKVSNKDAIIDKNKTKIQTTEPIKNVQNLSATNIQADNNMEKLIKLQQAEEQAKKLAEQKARQEQARLAQQKAQAESKKKAEALAKKKAQEEAKKLAQQKAQTDAKKKADAEALAKKKAQEEAKKLAEQKAAEELAKKQAEEQKKLITYNENVLWNQWRANVSNKIVYNLDKNFTSIAPPGTVYSYSFNVNNKRQVSNISVRISKGYINPTTQQGIFMIRRAIESLNLSNVLSLPASSQRTNVTVSAAIKIVADGTFGTLDASMFNDVEVIKKQRYE